MNSMRYFLLLMGALGFFRCGLSATQNQWLNPSHTPTSPYTFEGSGGSISFPSSAYKEWSIFNASLETSETAKSYDVVSDEAGTSLSFNAANILDEKAWLSLGISATDDPDQEPFELLPEGGKIRFDNFYAKVRFAPSAVCPSIEDLQEMYFTYADRNSNRDSDDPVRPVSAKLGLCVKEDGHFYILRVYTATTGNGTDGATATDSTTGSEDAIHYEFVRSPVAYSDVGGGTVIIRVEFQTYIGPDNDYDLPVRAYRIWASKDGTDEKCLSNGLGYRWITTEEEGYSFDFSSLEDDEDCNWLFPMDQAYAIMDTTDVSGIDTVQQIAFNATEGAFYSAWMATNKNIADQATLSAYALGAFENYAVPTSANFDSYVAWATSNNVDITEHLGSEEDTQDAFDAFLLNASPEDLEGQTVALSVTGIVTDKDANTVTITVRGPEGSDITKIPAAKLCVVRAATLDELAAAEPVECTATRTAQQTLTVVLPDADKYPFMKACLLPKAE